MEHLNIFLQNFDPVAEELAPEEVLGNEQRAGIQESAEHPNRPEPAIRPSGSRKRKSPRRKGGQDAVKRIRGPPWEPGERESLVKLRVEGKSFEAVAQHLVSRNARQCEHQMYSLQSQCNKLKKHESRVTCGRQQGLHAYAEMDINERRAAKLPDKFDPKLLQLMESVTNRALQKSEPDGQSGSWISKSRSEGGLQLRPPSSTSNLNTAATEGLSSIGTSYTVGREGEVSHGRKLSVSDTRDASKPCILVIREKMLKLREGRLETDKELFRLEKLMHETGTGNGADHA